MKRIVSAREGSAVIVPAWIRTPLLALWAWMLRHPWSALALIIAGLGIRVFGEMVDEFYEQELSPVDLRLQAALQPYHAPALDTAARLISDLLVLPWIALLIVPMLIGLLAQRREVAALVFLLVPAFTGLLVEMLKLLFGRERPPTAIIDEIGHSFPSGHATGSVVVYGLLGYLTARFLLRARWARGIALALAALMILLTGLARVYLHVHYPSDVAAGWGAGAIILAGAILFLEAWERRAGSASP